MKTTLPGWFDKRARRHQLDEYVNGTDQAMFGFREMPTAEKETWVRRHFDQVAANYDFMNTLLSLGIHYLWKRMAVNMLAPAPGERVIDVCGGTGDLSIIAHRKTGNRGRVVVYDINHRMIAAGRATASHRQIRDRLLYVQGNAEQISFPDASFDVAMVGFGIRNVTRLKQAFREMHRVLKPGGRLLCLEFSKPVNPVFRWLYDVYSFQVMPRVGELLVRNREGYACLPETIRLFSLPEELSAVMASVGFDDVQYRRLTNGIAVAHTAHRPQH